MKQVGLFFGSFNPIHVGHLIIANTMHQHTDLEEIWFVVSPQNPFKKKASLLDQNQRLEMVEMAIKDNFHFRSSNIEFQLPQPSYTIDTLTHLHEKHKDFYQFHLIMGSDNLINFHKWKNFEQILTHHKIFAYNRPGSEKTDFHSHKRVAIVNGPLLHISASYIREEIKNEKSIQYLVPQNIFNFIQNYHLYK